MIDRKRRLASINQNSFSVIYQLLKSKTRFQLKNSDSFDIVIYDNSKGHVTI